MQAETYLKNGQYTIELRPESHAEEDFLNRFYLSNDEPTIQTHHNTPEYKNTITISKEI